MDGAISKARIDTDYPTLAKFLVEYYDVDTVNKLPVEKKKQLKALQIQNNYFKRSRIIKDEKLINRQIEEFSYTAQELEVWHEMEEKEIDPWVRTMIPSCAWDCDYYDLCVIELLGQDSSFMRRAKYQPSKYIKGRGLGHGKGED